jgi:hypothetical protein
MTVIKLRNLLVGAGAYYLSKWVAFLLAMAYGKLIDHVIWPGYFSAMFVMTIVIEVPTALGAALAGASAVWLVESERPQRWAVFPAVLYFLTGFLGWHFAHPPVLRDRAEQVVGALFPAVMCLVGGIVAARRRTAGTLQQTPPTGLR